MASFYVYSKDLKALILDLSPVLRKKYLQLYTFCYQFARIEVALIFKDPYYGLEGEAGNFYDCEES